MTNKEAIEYLKWMRPVRPYSLDKIKVQQSIDLAINALEERTQDDLISREALKNYARKVMYEKNATNFSLLKIFDEIIDNAPTVSERPQGEWIFNQYDGNPNIGNWHCSECRKIVFGGATQKPADNFCPNCGADMRGGEENDT